MTEISDEEKKRFSIDRSVAGRLRRVVQQGREATRDAITRKQWGITQETQAEIDSLVGKGLLFRSLRNPIGGIANVITSIADGVMIPVQIGSGVIGQAGVEVQDALSLPTWDRGDLRSTDLWESGREGYKDLYDALVTVGLAPVGQIARRPRLPQYDEDLNMAMRAGYNLKEANYSAQPYSGKGHHQFIKSADIRRYKKEGRDRLVNLGESKYNVLQPKKGTSRLRFYKQHVKVDPKASVMRLATGMKPFHIDRYGIKRYGPVGRLWHGTPTRTKAIVLGPPAAAAGGLVWTGVSYDDYVPTEDD